VFLIVVVFSQENTDGSLRHVKRLGSVLGKDGRLGIVPSAVAEYTIARRACDLEDIMTSRVSIRSLFLKRMFQ